MKRPPAAQPLCLLLAAAAMAFAAPTFNLVGPPLSFEANHGQAAPSVKFLARGVGYALFLTVDSAVFRIHSAGAVSMKLAGEGAFDHADRQAAMKFAFQNATVDSVTMGYKNTQEIDAAIQNVNMALA